MVAYPIHQVPLELGGRIIPDKFVACGTDSVLLLPEQVRLTGSVNELFCLRERKLVLVEASIVEQAKAAAAAEGFQAYPELARDVQPGDLDDHTRRQIRFALRLEQGTLPKSEDFRPEDLGRGSGMLLGLLDGESKLTLAGRKLAIAIVDPTIPESVTRSPLAADYLAKYERHGRRPKARPTKRAKPSQPMVCACGHGVGQHLGSERGLCREPGCDCERYRQPKAAKKAS